MAHIEVESLYIYPIKGCRAIVLEEAKVTKAGLANDRRFMVVDSKGTFLSQRTHPQLGRVHVSLDRNEIIISAPRHYGLTLPSELTRGERATVKIWRDETEALVSKEGSAWFSEFLEEEARLVFIPDEHLRPTNPKYSNPQDQVGFADAYPLLCAGIASLEDLNARLPNDSPKLEMLRFRPNLTLVGAKPFEEDDFALVRIGSTTFRRGRLCERCVVTTLDPETGAQGKEPLRTLATFRKWEGAVWFGSNWIPDENGQLRVGDVVEVLGRSPARTS